MSDGDERATRMWEIAENLHRADLTALERDEHVAEWLRLSDQSSQPETKGHRPRSGVNNAARTLGVGKADAHRATKVDGLTPDAKQAARDAGLDDNRSAQMVGNSALATSRRCPAP